MEHSDNISQPLLNLLEWLLKCSVDDFTNLGPLLKITFFFFKNLCAVLLLSLSFLFFFVELSSKLVLVSRCFLPSVFGARLNQPWLVLFLVAAAPLTPLRSH